MAMTVQDLYNWAVENNVENCEILVRDCYGSEGYVYLPDIVEHTFENGESYKEIEL